MSADSPTRAAYLWSFSDQPSGGEWYFYLWNPDGRCIDHGNGVDREQMWRTLQYAIMREVPSGASLLERR